MPRGGQLAFARGADYEAELGVALDFDHLGLTAGARGGFPGAGDRGEGAALLLRAEGQRRAPLVAPAVVVRLNLERVEDDAAFVELVRRLRGLASDPGVAAVLLHIEDVNLGLGRIEELRDLVGVLRARGKRVYAYGSFPSTRDYYLATACDAIVLHPAGTLSLTGFSQTVTFYKRAMDTLGVNVDLVRIGEFKGAMEPFIINEQSAPVRANKNDLLDDVFRRLVSAVSRARTAGARVLDEARVRVLVDRGLFTPYEAQLVGLVDAVKDDEELEAYLRSPSGDRPSRSANRTRHRRKRPGRRATSPSSSSTAPSSTARATGSPSPTISRGRTRSSRRSRSAAATRPWAPSSCASTARAARPSRRTSSRAPSASCAAAGKPVVVSMGDVAASGGYISAPADAIFAEPSTISGSIGIFGYKVDVRKLMGTLGLGVETYRRGQHADYLSPYRPWTDEEIKIAAEKIRHFYELFLGTVVEGRRARGLTRARVDELGRGQVWTGRRRRASASSTGWGASPRPSTSRRASVTYRSARATSRRSPSCRAPAAASSSASPASRASPTTSRIPPRAPRRAGVMPPLRLLAPFLLGDGSGVEARLPYDIEIR